MSKINLPIILLQSPLDVSADAITAMVGEDFLSAPYYFWLTLTVESDSVNVDDLLRQPISFQLGDTADNSRIYHGLIYQARLTTLAETEHQTLQLLVQPWLRFLADKPHSKVFAVAKPLSIPKIIEQIFHANGYYNFQFQLHRDYSPLNVCVQYRESDFNFITRLLKDAGIYYYFMHTQDKHTLILTDAPYPQIAKPATARHISQTHTDTHISEWEAITEFKPTNSTTPLFELMRQPQSYSTTILAGSNYMNWQAGTRFNLTEHDIASQNGDYYITAIGHHIDEQTLSYKNNFKAQRINQTFAPSLNTAVSLLAPELLDMDTTLTQLLITEPKIGGLLTAIVTGPQDRDIYTDKYGRVKVKFKWDTSSNTDENSFAWVPVKQAWGSQQFGAHFTPRVGQEVLVSFEHGNPNKPIIIGVLPNDSNQPPFATTPSKLGFASRSLDKEASQKEVSGHQFVFDDDPKQPNILLQSYRDLTINTANNLTATIGGTHTTTVQEGNAIHTVNGKLIINASKAVHLVSGNSRISITPSDIIVEADKIVFGKGSSNTAGANVNHIQHAIKNQLNLADIQVRPTPEKQAAQKPKVSVLKNKPEKYDYYLVTYNDEKMLLTSSIDQIFSEISGNFNLSDFFEEERWYRSEKNNGEVAEEKIKFAKEEYNKRQIKQQNRDAWRGRYIPKSTTNETVSDNELASREASVKMGAAGSLAAGAVTGTSQANKRSLISHLDQITTEIYETMPQKGGVLVEAIYQVAETEVGLNLLLTAVYSNRNMSLKLCR